MTNVILQRVLNPYTIKAVEALEGCSIEEVEKRLTEMFQNLKLIKKTEMENKPKETFPLEKYPIYMGAAEIQELLHVCEAVAYQVLHCKDCPTMYMGKRMVVQREAFWEFLKENRGKRLW